MKKITPRTNLISGLVRVLRRVREGRGGAVRRPVEHGGRLQVRALLLSELRRVHNNFRPEVHIPLQIQSE